MNDVQTRHVPERKVLSLEGHVRQAELESFLRRSRRELAEALADGRVVLDDYLVVIYKGTVSETADGPVEVCMLFDGDMEAPRGMAIRVEPDHNEVFTTLTRAESEYPRILEAFHALVEYVRANGFREWGSPRQVYIGDFDSTEPDDCFIELARPIRAIPALAAAPQLSWPGERAGE